MELVKTLPRENLSCYLVKINGSSKKFLLKCFLVDQLVKRYGPESELFEKKVKLKF